MKIRMSRMSLGGRVVDLWRQIAAGFRPKKVAGRVRRMDDRHLYWAENCDAGQAGASCSALEGRTDDGVETADYWFIRGESLIQQGRPSEAGYCFEQVLKQDPHDVFALIYRGYCLYQSGCYETALACLRQATLLDPRRPEIDIIKALCLCHLRQFEEALDYFTKALRCGLDSSALWNNKGFCLARLGRHRDASAAFRVALARCGAESLEILCNAASLLVELGDCNQALGYFDRALRINAEDHILLNNVAFCLEALGRCDQALKCYEKALSLGPDCLTYLYNKGLCLIRLQRWDQAFECLREVVGRDPGNGIAWCGLAAASLARGEADEALDCYNKALAPIG